MEDPRPDVLHIGFSKCASTFLQAFFEEHPGIFLVNQSHYLAPFDFSEYPERRDDYFALFREAAPNQVRLESDEHIVLPLFHPVLEAAATTLDSVVEVSARIKSIQPDCRIIMVIRNQTDLIVSRYSEYVICGGKLSFSDFVGEFLCSSRDGLNYYQNCYAAITRVFRDDFGEDNVLVLLQEELARDEPAVIRTLSEFLGVEALRPSRRGLVARRVGLSRLGIGFLRTFNRVFVKRPKRSFHEAQVRMPFLLYKVLQRSIRMLDYYLPKALKGDKNSILDEATARRIRDTFAEDNRRLADLLGRDLAALGYY